jgi:hypothetical protein
MDMFSKLINELNGKLPNVPDDQPVGKLELEPDLVEAKPTQSPLEMIINSAIDSAEGQQIEWDDLNNLLDEADKDIMDYLEAQLTKRGYSVVGP